MHFSIALALAAARVLAQSDFTLNPSTVVAGELTQIKVTLTKNQTCPQKAATILLQVTGAPNRSFIITHEPAYFNTPTKELMSFPDYLFLTFRQNLSFKFPSTITSGDSVKFSLLSLDPVGSSLKKPYSLTLSCDSRENNGLNPNVKSLLTKELNITVTAAPPLPEVVKLAPSKASSTLVSTIALNVPWPKECRTTKKPLVKLSLDPDTIRDGGALSSDPQPGYFVYGLKDYTRQLISLPKSNETIKKDNFTTIELQRYSYALHNQVNVAFKFLGQQVPEGTVKDTHLKVEFICENLGVKLYSIETDNSPIIKVSHAISVSVAIPTLLLSFLAFIV